VTESDLEDIRGKRICELANTAHRDGWLIEWVMVPVVCIKRSEALEYNAQGEVLEVITDALTLSGPTPGDVRNAAMCVEAGASSLPFLTLIRAFRRLRSVLYYCNRVRPSLFRFLRVGGDFGQASLEASLEARRRGA